MRVLDAVIVAGDVPEEVLGAKIRQSMRLSVDGTPASLSFLWEYFRAGRDSKRALASLRAGHPPIVSLNGPYLSQFLEAKGYATELVPLFSLHRRRLLALLEEGPRAVAISTTFLPFPRQIDPIAAFIKEHAPETIVIAGGIQVWKSYKHRMLLEQGAITDDIREAVSRDNYLLDIHRPSPVDIFVVSERGETTLARVLEAIRTGTDYRTLDNVAYFQEGRWHVNKVTSEPETEVRVDWSRYSGDIGKAYVPVQASLGCRFRCRFCDFCGLRPLRTRDPMSLIEEIRTISPLDGVRRVNFTDDNLFASRKRTKEFCGMLVSAGLSLRWRSFMRVTTVDEEIAEFLARSGCAEVSLGIESGDPDMLLRMDKRSTPEGILSGVRMLNDHGINTKSCFIIGFPGETTRSVKNTVDLLNAYPTGGPAVQRYVLFLYAVLPLSAAASRESRAKYSLRGYLTDWTHSTMSADEAREHMRRIPDALKLELSPTYLFEMPEAIGLQREQVKQAYVLRNKLHRAQRGLLPEEPEEKLWKDLEGCFAGAQTWCADRNRFAAVSRPPPLQKFNDLLKGPECFLP